MPDPNRFLRGPFAPVEEEITAFDLPVTGTLPAGLNGRYLRNGPNPLGLDDPGYRFCEGHWFLGPGMVHGVRLRDGKAEWYRNRWVRSRLLAEAMDEKWPAGPVHNDMDFAANTHIIAHAGRYLATVEAGPLPYELSGELDTVGPCDFSGTLPGGFAAHTKLDHATGELHAIAYFWAWDHVQYVIIGTDGTVARTTDIPVADGPMMHDFALTPGTVTQHRLDDRPQEFARTDERVTGRPHRYGYSAVIGAVGHATISPGGDFADEAFSNALLKHDLTAGIVQAHEFGKDATAGEGFSPPPHRTPPRTTAT